MSEKRLELPKLFLLLTRLTDELTRDLKFKDNL